MIPASVMMKEIEAQIVEETGLRCCICLEGYKNQPDKVFSFESCPLDIRYFVLCTMTVLFVTGSWYIHIYSQSNSG